jgi:hypothetical protein
MTETDDKILMQLGTEHHVLAQARTIEDFKRIADTAVAAEVYARRVKLSQESVDYALEIKRRAEQGLGELLARTPKHKGLLKRGPTVPESSHGEPSTLAELGICLLVYPPLAALRPDRAQFVESDRCNPPGGHWSP